MTRSFRVFARWRFAAAVCTGFAMNAAVADSVALHEKARLAEQIEALVTRRDYAAVLHEIERDTKSQARFADGLWRTSAAYANFADALTRRVDGAKGWDATLKSLGGLANRDPNGWLLVVEASRQRAWAARGTGYASTVAPGDWKEFHTYASLARAVLEQHKRELAHMPAWYSLRLLLATDLGEGDEKAQAIFDEAVARHPAYHAIYFARQRDLSPIWNGHGRRDRVLDLQARVAAMGGATATEGIYARLVWLADKSGFAVTHSPRVDADAFRDSALMLAQAYPDQWNLQALFLMTCERSDKATTRRLGLMVARPLLPEVWGVNLPIYESCKDWSEGRLEGFVVRNHDGDETKEFLIR